MPPVNARGPGICPGALVCRGWVELGSAGFGLLAHFAQRPADDDAVLLAVAVNRAFAVGQALVVAIVIARVAGIAVHRLVELVVLDKEFLAAATSFSGGAGCEGAGGDGESEEGASCGHGISPPWVGAVGPSGCRCQEE